ncbi:hypothetical protein [uncultured Sphingomonas sp.]|uniref:hypothetical protein n=1 Tax=uncultured Sphingomonas sp. TaxID=158754 RepID=UPI0025D6E3F1|nr:hypothetical protein [uncultured Sphingomonas sp.]
MTGLEVGQGAARALRVCFFFNAQRHQLLHGISTAVALARREGFAVTVMSPSCGHIDYARMLVARLGGAPIAFVSAEAAMLNVARRVTGSCVPPKLLTLAVLAPELSRFDAIALPERTSIILRTAGLRGPCFIHLDHGAGDRAIGFDPRIRKFDFVLMAGEKHRRRLQREGLIREGRYAVVGYPKFEAADAAREPGWTPFPGDRRPIVLYNPHFSTLGSWERCGAAVLRAFAGQDRYNLVLAPHVRLLDSDRAKARWQATLAPYADHPRIFIDPGSDRSIDMTYTDLADIYLGDVSSQVYEFLRRPRPCLFLDANGVDWRADENYGHWHFGPVLRDCAGLIAAIDAAGANHATFAAPQEAGFAATFDARDSSGSERAAEAIAMHLSARQRVRPRPHRRPADWIAAPRRHVARAARRAAVILPAVLTGWLMHEATEPTPTIAAPLTFVDEAARSLDVLLIRGEMRSQAEATDYDIDEVLRTTAIRLPKLPAGWRVLDMQLFPSHLGTSVQTLILTPEGERVALVGMRIETPAGRKPLLAHRQDDRIAYWEDGDMAYALVGRTSARRLLRLADRVGSTN